MFGIGFNPVPNISLGDMEDIFDIEAELNLDTEKPIEEPPKKVVDNSELIKQFSIEIPTSVKIQGQTEKVVEQKQQPEKHGIKTRVEEPIEIIEQETKIEEAVYQQLIQPVQQKSAASQIIQKEFSGRQNNIGQSHLDELEKAKQEAERLRKQQEAEEQKRKEEQILAKAKADAAAEYARKQEEDRLKLEREKIELERQRMELKRKEDEQRAKEREELEFKRKQEEERIRLEREKLEIERQKIEMQRKEQERQHLIDQANKEKELAAYKLRLEQQLKEEEARRERERQQREQAERDEKLRRLLEIKNRQSKKQAQLTQRPTQATKRSVKQSHSDEMTDKIIDNAIRTKAQQTAPKEEKVVKPVDNKYEKYDRLDIDALYAEVKEFLKKHNVTKSKVDIKILEDEFGKHNIKQLILKSYLISIGKGVTIGR